MLTSEDAIARVLDEVPNKTGASEDTALYELLSDGLYSLLQDGGLIGEQEARDHAVAMCQEVIESANAAIRRLTR